MSGSMQPSMSAAVSSRPFARRVVHRILVLAALGGAAALPLAALPLAADGRTEGAAVEDAARRAEAMLRDGDSFGARTEYLGLLGRFADLPDAEREAAIPEAYVALLRVGPILEHSGVLDGDGTQADDGGGALAGPLRRVADLPPATPALAQVTAEARRLLGFALLDSRGERAGADAIWAPLAPLGAWKVLGPFDNERGGGYATRYGPETRIAEEKRVAAEGVFDGKKRQVAWRELPGAPLAGLVELAGLLDPNEESLAYALTHVRSDRDREALLLLGTDESFKVWVNGEEVAASDLIRTFQWDQDSVPVRLREGWNSVLLKVCQTTGPWRFAARLAAPGGGAIDGVEEGTPGADEKVAWASGPAGRVPSAEESAVPTGEETTGEETAGEQAAGQKPAAQKPAAPEPAAPAASDAAPTARSPVEALLDAMVAAAPTRGRLPYLRGTILQKRTAQDRGQHPDTEAFLEALRLEASDPGILLSLAQSHEREATIEAQKDENQWREAMERAAALGCPLADYRLGAYYAETFQNRSRAMEHILRALAASPAFAEARLFRGRIEDSLGFPRGTEKALEEVARARLRPIGTDVEIAGSLIRRGRTAEAESLLRAALSRSARNGAVRGRLASILADRDAVDEALSVLRGGIEVDPWSTRWHDARAGLLEGRGRLEEALAEVDASLGILPESHELLRRRADLLLKLGRKPDAIAALGRALELQPNLPGIREYVEFLRAEKSTFDDEFRRDVAAIIRAARESPADNVAGDPARILLDMTAVEVNRDGTTKEFVQQVLEILNDRGIQMFDRFSTYYASGEQFLEFKVARVHHPDGTKSDARLSRHGGGAGSGDFRSASVDLPSLSAGDIVEVEYLREDTVQSFFGDYFGRLEVFQSSLPIREKVLALRVPAGRDFYFHQRNLDVERKLSEDPGSGKRTYTWEKRDIPKRDPEPGMPSPRETSPVLQVSTFESWDAFSRWYWNLIRKQFEVSPEIARKVRELTSGAETELEKIRAIYDFVVTDIRYNAWEFGVHGFKPYNAATIFARQFGDCKDKATLMTVMLGEVGIRAWPVLIYGDPRRSAEDMTLPLVNHFNHCISYVPASGARPELYLDGTATFHSLQELPTMDRGAQVLVVRDDGGSIQEIPWNEPEGFSHEEEIQILLGEDRGAEIQVRGASRGDFAVSIRRSFEIAAQRKTDLEKAYGGRYAGVSVKDASFSDLANLDEAVTFSFAMQAPRVLEEAPEGLVLKPPEDLFSTGGMLGNIASLEERTTDVILGPPRRAVLRVRIALPPGYRVRSLPAPREAVVRAGRLSVTYESGPDGIRMERVLELTSPRVPLADYTEFREFAATVNQLREERILLERS